MNLFGFPNKSNPQNFSEVPAACSNCASSPVHCGWRADFQQFRLRLRSGDEASKEKRCL
jgi:hypothetical protein